MPVNPLKEFFKRTKAEVKFSRAGPGQKLSSSKGTEGCTSTGADNPSTSAAGQAASARQAAAEAAMKRFNKDSNTKPAQRPRISDQDQPTKSSVAPAATDNVTDKNPSQLVQKELPVVDGIAQREVQVYSTDELAQRIKQPDIDDDFFRLTVEDAKLFKKRYDEEKARNEILRTSEMRRREAEAKKPTTNIARIRFKLPNDIIIEASFSGEETLNLVRDWLVATCLDKTGLELKNYDILFALRPIKEADFQRTVKQLGLLPATTLTIVNKTS